MANTNESVENYPFHVQLLRGNTVSNVNYEGLEGEVTLDTDTHELIIHSSDHTLIRFPTTGLLSQKLKDGEFKGDVGNKGEVGDPGLRGYVYTPAITTEVKLSYSNNGNLINPPLVNLKGPRGDTGVKGVNGDPGPKGGVGTTICQCQCQCQCQCDCHCGRYR